MISSVEDTQPLKLWQYAFHLERLPYKKEL